MAWELDNLTNPFGYKKGAQKPVNNMSGLLDFAMQANQYAPVTGDIQSGILAANDLSQGNYSSAALNAVGLLPFIPSLGTVKNVSENIDILNAPIMEKTLKAIPAKESLWDVANSNFNYGIPSGNKTVKINSLKGMMSASSDDLDKVNDLVSKISSPNGYIERLIVDNNGNVIEGQHRLNALKKLGINDVPVSVIYDMNDAFEAVKNTGLRNENARQIIQNAFDMKKEAGSVKKALDMYEIPSQYKSAYEVAFKYLK